MKVNSVFIKGYEEKARLGRQWKQSQTNPIRSKANVNMGKLYFSQWRTPPTFVGEACPCESRGTATALPRSGLYKLPSNKALSRGRPPGRSLTEEFFAGKPWPAGRPRPFGSDGR